MIDITKRTFYASDDRDFSGVYRSVEVYDPAGNSMAKYEQNEDGLARMEGFIAALEYILRVPITTLEENANEEAVQPAVGGEQIGRR